MPFAIHFGSGVGAVLFSGLVATLASVSPAAAQNNVSLDNLRITMPEGKSTLTIPHVEVTNTNLSRDEVARLFSSEVTKDETRALLSRMKADRISIPESAVSDKDSRVAIGPLLATGIAEGRFQKVSLGGFKGTFNSEKTGEGNVTSGPIELEDGNMAGLLAAAGASETPGAAVRLARISWTGLDATFPDKDTPKSAAGGNLWHVRLGSLTSATNYDGLIPLKGSGDLRGLVIEPPKASKIGQSLTTFGYERIELGLTVAATYDAAAHTVTLQDYTLTGAGAGTLGLTGLFGSLDPAIFTAVGPARLKAFSGGDVSELRAKFVNQGLMEKTLAYFAAQQKKTVQAVKAEWGAMATQIIPIMLGGDPSSLSLAQSLQSFIENPKSLTVTLKSRGAAVPLAQLPSIKDPATFLALVEVTAKAND